MDGVEDIYVFETNGSRESDATNFREIEISNEFIDNAVIYCNAQNYLKNNLPDCLKKINMI